MRFCRVALLLLANGVNTFSDSIGRCVFFYSFLGKGVGEIC